MANADEPVALSALADTFLIECPRCGRRALVEFRPDGAARMTCPICGLMRDRSEGEGRLLGEPIDGCFREPLWLRVRCAGHELWAYNERHLDALERILVEPAGRPGADALGRRNSLLASRLPRWMVSAKDRPAIRNGLAKLRARLGED